MSEEFKEILKNTKKEILMEMDRRLLKVIELLFEKKIFTAEDVKKVLNS